MFYNDGVTLPLGKLLPEQLAQLLQQLATDDPSVVLGPGIGRDCAVIDRGDGHPLVAKSDPITFATDEIDWYTVHVKANDLSHFTMLNAQPVSGVSRRTLAALTR